MLKKHKFPRGKIVLKTVTMPSNTNANGDIFGGWIMSQIDMSGAILAKEISGGKVVTVKVDHMTFFKPVSVGDIINCYAECVKIGISSITVNVEVWMKKVYSKPLGQFYCAAEAILIYVAINESGKSREILPMSII